MGHRIVTGRNPAVRRERPLRDADDRRPQGQQGVEDSHTRRPPVGSDGGAQMTRIFAAAAALLLGSCNLIPQRTLTACEDPNNLPFSNKAGQGFENKLAEMIAA